MTTKLLVGFLAIGMTAALGAKNTFKVNLLQDSIVDGKTVKAGTAHTKLPWKTAMP
jgi:hypothetical protein